MWATIIAIGGFL
ncbi:hypothetical protein SAMN03159309_02529 [Pseudomonas sp. NFACC36]|nr:hypothetical protein SAMN03159309_02529 [Pseudomonas sp. NFACC36]